MLQLWEVWSLNWWGLAHERMQERSKNDEETHIVHDDDDDDSKVVILMATTCERKHIRGLWYLDSGCSNYKTKHTMSG